MTEREMVRADEVRDETCILDSGRVREIVKAFTVGARTTFIDSDGESFRYTNSTMLELASTDEVSGYDKERDRGIVAEAFRALARQIIDRKLPVPHDGRGVVVSFDLVDDGDLKPWSEWLSKRPQRVTSRPVIQAEAEGVEVYVYGPGTSGEFGPDLSEPSDTRCARCHEVRPVNGVELCIDCEAELALKAAGEMEDVEHRDSVGAFPVVEPQLVMVTCPVCEVGLMRSTDVRCVDCAAESALQAMDEMRAEENEREGFAPPSGHAVQAPDEALKYDRFNEGNQA